MNIKTIGVAAVSAVAIGVSIGVEPSQALTVFSDRAAFESAATGLTNIGFEGIVSADSYEYTFGDMTINGVSFSDTGGHLYVVDHPLVKPLTTVLEEY